MEFKTSWKENMLFKAKVGNHLISMDASSPLGHDKGATPKELFAASLSGCTGMDIVGLLQKYKQDIKKFEIETKVQSSNDGYPIVFSYIDLIYHIEGEVEEALALQAIRLAQTKYCGVSAMMARSTSIHWRLFLNGKECGTGDIGEYLSGE